MTDQSEKETDLLRKSAMQLNASVDPYEKVQVTEEGGEIP